MLINRMVFINKSITHGFLLGILIFYCLPLFAEDCGYFKTKREEYRKPLKQYMKSIKNQDDFISAAEFEFKAFDTMNISVDENPCEKMKCEFREELINGLLKKVSKDGIRNHEIRSSCLLANIQMSYCRRLVNKRISGSFEQKIARRIKIYSICMEYYEEAAADLKYNFKELQDSVSVGTFCDVVIKEADLFVGIGCMLSLISISDDNRIDKQLQCFEPIEEKINEFFDKTLDILDNRKKEFCNYKGWNKEGFERIDKKIEEINLLRNNIEKQKIIGQKALEPY